MVLLLVTCFYQQNMEAQTAAPAPTSPLRERFAVLNIDSKDASLNKEQLGSILRTELEKLDTFEIMDRYDASFLLQDKMLNAETCFGKLCAIDIGRELKVDKIITGSIVHYGDNMQLTLRLININTQAIERTQVNEYLYIPGEIALMLRLSVLQLFDRPVNQDLLASVSRKSNYENAINNYNKVSVKLSGPRTGFSYFTGETARIMATPQSEGGFNCGPLMFQFGYQFEKQYLNEGNYQALFEFLPMVTGFNQNLFIPSLTIMNGFRENRFGWEIALGPTFSGETKAKGYYDENQKWHLASDWKDATTPNPYALINRLDSRGDIQLNAGFIIAVGKTIKSGRLNIPINFYYAPSKNGDHFGISLGFNAKKPGK